MKRIAAIDVGSNAIRLAIGELKIDGRIEITRTVRAPVRLGRDVFKDGVIQEKTAKKAIKAFEKFHKLIKKYKVKHLLAVATSAAREAKNGQQFVNLIKARTDIHICIIDGVEEARLINLAVARAVDVSQKWSALIDIGGGSLEVSLLKDGVLNATQTFKMGTVRILTVAGADSHENNFAKIDLAKIELTLKSHEKAVQEFIQNTLGQNPVQLCAGTGGNIESLGKLRVQVLGRSASNFLFLEDLEKIIQHISTMSYEDRIKKLDLRSDRADVILPAALVLRLVLKHLKTNELLIPFIGLKDGVLVHLQQLKDEGREDQTCLCQKSETQRSRALPVRTSESRRI